MLVHFIPKDLLLFIISEWLDSVHDFSSFDRALANKEMRYLLFANSSFPPSHKLAVFNQSLVTIRYDKKMIDVARWKEKRFIEIKNVLLQRYNAIDQHLLPCMGSYFQNLSFLEMKHCLIKFSTNSVIFLSMFCKWTTAGR